MADLASLEDQKKKFYQQRRDEAQRNAQATLQEGENALTRRFSSLGMQGSGASIAANIKNRENADLMKQKAMNDISAQEVQSNMSELEAEKGRQFSSGEAQKQREFAVAEGERGRQFQKGISDQEMALRKEMMASDKESKLKSFDLAERQFQLAKDSEEFNRRLAELAMGNKGGEDGGFLGTGLSNESLIGAGLGFAAGGLPGALIGSQIKKSDRGGLGVEIGGWSF